MTLNVTRSKVSHTCTTGTRESQIALRFALHSLVFQLIKVYNGEFEISKRKSLNFKSPQRRFVRTIWRKLEDNVEAISRRSSVLKYSFSLGSMLTKRNKGVKISIFKIWKIPKAVFRATEKIIQEKFDQSPLQFVEEEAFWKSYFRKNRKCTEWPPNDFERHKANSPYTCWTTASESQIHSVLLYCGLFSR